MHTWWHNGGVRLDPENEEERAALLLLWNKLVKQEPEEQRAATTPSGAGVVSEQLLDSRVGSQDVPPRGVVAQLDDH